MLEEKSSSLWSIIANDIFTLNGDADTLLTGPVVDQTALYGLLKKVRDLGMPLVSVNPVQYNETRLEKESKK